MRRNFVFGMASAVFAWTVGMAFASKPEELVEFPVSDNLRGHENIEWSTSYAFGLTDASRKLPRVLLVGDSICGGYKDGVRDGLKGRMNVTFWTSSYCVTSPGYLRLLSFYLDEAEYAVIHFNNGLHSLSTPDADWEKGLCAALKLIRAKQPKAKIVWAASTPLKDKAKTVKVKALNDIAARVVAEMGGIATDDLFALMDPLDRETNWSDTYHFKPDPIARQARQVAASCLSALSDLEGRTQRAVILKGQYSALEIRRAIMAWVSIAHWIAASPVNGLWPSIAAVLPIGMNLRRTAG